MSMLVKGFKQKNLIHAKEFVEATLISIMYYFLLHSINNYEKQNNLVAKLELLIVT